MKRPSDPPRSAEELREKIIGFGERSGRKSFYPELRDRLATLERFRALLDKSNDAILTADVAGGIVCDVNDATCRMLGRTREELAAMPLRALSPAIAEGVRDASSGQVITTLHARDGREIPVEATVAFRSDGGTRSAVIVARDVSERLRSERALRESEERFRAVFEGAAIGIGVIDVYGHLKETNRELQALLGRSAGELRARSYLSFVHAEDRARFRRHHSDLLRGRAAGVSVDVRLVRSDGEIVWALVSASVVAAGEGSPAYIVAAAQDVTARKRAREALEFLSRASARLATSLDVTATLENLAALAVPCLGDFCAISAVAAGDGEHRLVSCADPARRALAEELIARRSLADLVGARSGALPAILDDARGPPQDTAAADVGRCELLGRLGLRSAIAIPLDSDEARGALLLATVEPGRRYGLHDLELATAFGHRATIALQNAMLLRRAREASRLKDEFLAVVSHELRTPLTAILGWMHLLKTKYFGAAEVGRGLSVVERNARALAQIIDDLLSVSQIVAGKLSIRPALTELSPVVEHAVEALAPIAESHRIVLHVECEPGLPRIMGDARRLQQVVWNLVSNAVKYTPDGGQVTVRLARAGGSAQLTVSDTGRGISREFLPHVFDQFRQEDGSSTRSHGGLGLGLTIVQHVVGLHGGTVRAESEGEGRGARFTIELPFASDAERAAGRDDGSAQLAPASTDPAVAATSGGFQQ